MTTCRFHAPFLLFWLKFFTTIAHWDILANRGYVYFEDDNRFHRFPRKAGRGPALNTSECDLIIGVPNELRLDMNLNKFYSKYTHAYGIPILSSNQPADDALIRGCYTVQFLLADRQDLRDAMHDSYGRVAIIGQTEKTTDIPEHAYLPDFWNERARGLGGTPSNPVSTSSEENILCYIMQDRWFEEDILVHEFSHGIHLISVNKVDPSYQDRLMAAFSNAKEKGLWQFTYAISNNKEYFAEGVQSFFNVEVHRAFKDMIHNNISTRRALLDYDPDLYELIREVFPCENEIVDRCANQSEISQQTLRMDCPYTRPTTPMVSEADVSIPTTEGAHTTYPTRVATFASNIGTDVTIPSVTMNPDCKDVVPFCEEIATLNECISNDVIRDMCPRTCCACAGCNDCEDLCSDLASRGFCDHRQSYMASQCGRSCGMCRGE